MSSSEEVLEVEAFIVVLDNLWRKSVNDKLRSSLNLKSNLIIKS